MTPKGTMEWGKQDAGAWKGTFTAIKRGEGVGRSQSRNIPAIIRGKEKKTTKENRTRRFVMGRQNAPLLVRMLVRSLNENHLHKAEENRMWQEKEVSFDH